MLSLKEKIMVLFLFGGLAGAGFIPVVAGGEGAVTLPPPPARLISPRDGEVLRGDISEKKFLWSVVAQARRYHLEVSSDREFLAIEKNIYPEQNSYTLCNQLHEGTFFWRVSSISAEGLEGRYSPVHYFIYPVTGKD